MNTNQETEEVLKNIWLSKESSDLESRLAAELITTRRKARNWKCNFFVLLALMIIEIISFVILTFNACGMSLSW